MSLLNLHLCVYGGLYTHVYAADMHQEARGRQWVGVLSPSHYARVTDGHMNSTGSLTKFLGV